MLKKYFRMVSFLFWIFGFCLLSVREAYADDMWVKVGRGMGNVLFGWCEIFNQPIQMSREERWPIAFFGGFFKGIAYTALRTAAGVYEMTTFPIPIPFKYKPIMKPEFVIPEGEF